MKWGVFVFIFIICFNVIIGNENIRLKKLECQGIFINQEKDDKINILENNYDNSYYIIYKNGSDGIYNSNEHFNGLSIFLKNKKEKYEDIKKSIYLSFLKKIYYSSILELNFLKKKRQHNHFFKNYNKINTCNSCASVGSGRLLRL